jgi:hypothetical protein
LKCVIIRVVQREKGTSDMTISTGKTRLRVFESALRDVKYLDGTSKGSNAPRFTTHAEALRLHGIKHQLNDKSREGYNLDC